ATEQKQRYGDGHHQLDQSEAARAARRSGDCCDAGAHGSTYSVKIGFSKALVTPAACCAASCAASVAFIATAFSVQEICTLQLTGAGLPGGAAGQDTVAVGFGNRGMTELTHQRARSKAARLVALLHMGGPLATPMQAVRLPRSATVCACS